MTGIAGSETLKNLITALVSQRPVRDLPRIGGQRPVTLEPLRCSFGSLSISTAGRSVGLLPVGVYANSF
jgi:hypothetical protein